MEEYIIGNIRKIIYTGDNGYRVGIIKVKKASTSFEYLKDKSLTFSGYFHDLDEDEIYKFSGGIINHYKYGEQFNVTFYEREMPEEKDSVVEFLSSGNFKGIGKKTATKIVEVLGNDAIRLIIDDSMCLLKVDGISNRQIETLRDGLLEYSNSYNTILKLNDLGFSSKDSMKMYNKFRENTLNIIDENIYSVIENIKEFTFKKIDLIALRIGYLRDDKKRIEASILTVMEELCNTIGHFYLHIDMIYKYTIMCLGNNISEDLFINCLNDLIINLKVVKVEEKYYLRSFFDAEENIVNRIVSLNKKKDFKIDNLDSYIYELEKNKHITYNEEQKEAIKNASIKNFLIITGGPGTGKTTIVSSIIDLYKKVHKINERDLIEELVVLAPTGRASKRLSEKSNFKASTIHSFLKWNKESDKFAINEFNKSFAKLVIIDEASMIDGMLFNSLLKGLMNDTKIIMVGDYDQLPSVGPGQLLKDLIESEKLNVIALKQLYRQGIDSNIISLAHDINKGIVNDELFNVKPDLDFIYTDDIVYELSRIAKVYKDVSYNDFQVLVPMYKGINGIDNYNKILQEIINPKSRKKKEITVGDVIYREGDKVLQLVNMPDERIFNGDIGTIIEIDNKEITVDFDINTVTFTPSTYSNFKHGYAISIHKSQGSEFDTVVLPVTLSYSKMLYRKLYYTAVTRSKKKLILIGDIKALKNAAINNSQDIRMTTIKDKIIKKYSI